MSSIAGSLQHLRNLVGRCDQLFFQIGNAHALIAAAKSTTQSNHQFKYFVAVVKQFELSWRVFVQQINQLFVVQLPPTAMRFNKNTRAGAHNTPPSATRAPSAPTSRCCQSRPKHALSKRHCCASTVSYWCRQFAEDLVNGARNHASVDAIGTPMVLHQTGMNEPTTRKKNSAYCASTRSTAFHCVSLAGARLAVGKNCKHKKKKIENNSCWVVENGRACVPVQLKPFITSSTTGDTTCDNWSERAKNWKFWKKINNKKPRLLRDRSLIGCFQCQKHHQKWISCPSVDSSTDAQWLHFCVERNQRTNWNFLENLRAFVNKHYFSCGAFSFSIIQRSFFLRIFLELFFRIFLIFFLR